MLRRLLQIVLGAALFVLALGLVEPLRGDRPRYVFLAALLAAGAMALSDALASLLAAAVHGFKSSPKGPAP